MPVCAENLIRYLKSFLLNGFNIVESMTVITHSVTEG